MLLMFLQPITSGVYRGKESSWSCWTNWEDKLEDYNMQRSSEWSPNIFVLSVAKLVPNRILMGTKHLKLTDCLPVFSLSAVYLFHIETAIRKWKLTLLSPCLLSCFLVFVLSPVAHIWSLKNVCTPETPTDSTTLPYQTFPLSVFLCWWKDGSCSLKDPESPIITFSSPWWGQSAFGPSSIAVGLPISTQKYVWLLCCDWSLNHFIIFWGHVFLLLQFRSLLSLKEKFD